MRKTIQLVSVYIGTIVGAGFATGREIYEFFSKFGMNGTIGIAISTGLFMYFGTKLMLISYRMKVKNFEQLLAYLFGKSVARIIHILVLFMTIVVTAVMVSGAGAMFEEQLHLPRIVGVMITLTISFLVAIFGFQGLFMINMIVVPVLVTFSLLLAIFIFSHSEMVFVHSSFSISVVFSSFSYVAFNLFLSQIVLVPLAYQLNDERAIKFGGVIAGLILGIILLCSHFSLLSLSNIDLQVPMAEVVKTTSKLFYPLYLCVIYGEIFTTIVANLFGFQQEFFKKNRVFVTLVIIVMIFPITLFHYGEMLSLVYPVFGYVSLLFLGGLLLMKVPEKK